MAYDRFMVHVDAGTEEKFATLTDSEFRAHIVGTLAVAAKSPVRGCLFVGNIEAQPLHIARRAGVTEKVASSSMHKMQEVGVLVRDEELGCWRVNNWENYQPERRDPTAAKRAKDYRDRRRSQIADATRGASRDDHAADHGNSRGVTPPEVEVEGEVEDVKGFSGGAPNENGDPQPPPIPLPFQTIPRGRVSA